MTGKGYTVTELLGLQVLSECGESAKKEVKSLTMPNSGLKGFVIFSMKGQDEDDASAAQAEEFKNLIRDEAIRIGLRKKPSIDTYYEIPNSVTVGTLLDFKDTVLKQRKSHGEFEIYIYLVRNNDFFLL